MEGNLSINEIYRRLEEMDGWELGIDSIGKSFQFDSFTDAIAFVNRVAEEAENANHHPDISIAQSKVFLSLSTQDEGGITIKDFKMAGLIDALR